MGVELIIGFDPKISTTIRRTLVYTNEDIV